MFLRWEQKEYVSKILEPREDVVFGILKGWVQIVDKCPFVSVPGDRRWLLRSGCVRTPEAVESVKSSTTTLDDSLQKPSSFSFSVRDACVAAGQVDAKVDGQSLAAHRFVLAAAIPYFRAMFGYDVVEAKMDRILLNVSFPLP
ncbi:hypothetical protein OSTOST_18997 [Ostertagia ostertagi]